MPGFKDPGLQERQQAAARARSAALAGYRAKPPIDAAVIAARTARRKARELAEAEKRVAALRAKEMAVEAKRADELRAAEAAEAAVKAGLDAAAQARADLASQKAAQKQLWTEADRKEARDARYAARKMRSARR